MSYFKKVYVTDESSGLTADVKQNINTLSYELNVNLEGHQCLENSTTINLGNGASYTGSGWQDTLDYGVLSVDVKSDQNSATNGLIIQWSNDGINVIDWDIFSILANIPKTFTFGPANRYYRIKYINGAIATGTFHITSILRRTYVKPSSHRIIDSIVADDDAELMKSVITGMNDNGVFVNVKTDLGGLLRVNNFPYLYAIAEGDILGHKPLLKFGTRSVVAANTNSLVWEGTAALYTYLTTAEQLKVSSSAATDNATGTGARTLTILGLDANWLEISETITMTGASLVTTTKSFIRVYRAYVETCGASLSNDGLITVTNNAGTNQLLVITASDGQTLMAFWTVPAAQVGYMTGFAFTTDTNKGARVSIRTRLNDGGIIYPWLIKYRAFMFSGIIDAKFDIPFKIPAKTDIEVRVLTPTGAGNTAAGATFEMWYESI